MSVLYNKNITTLQRLLKKTLFSVSVNRRPLFPSQALKAVKKNVDCRLSNKSEQTVRFNFLFLKNRGFI